jgi:transposase-like protein
MSSYPKVIPVPQPRRPRVVCKRSAAERERLLKLFERSGQTLKRFCDEHDLPLSTLTYWRRRTALSAPEALEGTLVEVPSCVAASSAAGGGAAEAVDIRLPNRVELRVSAGTDPVWLEALLRGLLACSG